MPLGHKDDVWLFDHIDTLGITVADAPRPDEIMVIVALAMAAGRVRASTSPARSRRTRRVEILVR